MLAADEAEVAESYLTERTLNREQTFGTKYLMFRSLLSLSHSQKLRGDFRKLLIMNLFLYLNLPLILFSHNSAILSPNKNGLFYSYSFISYAKYSDFFLSYIGNGQYQSLYEILNPCGVKTLSPNDRYNHKFLSRSCLILD